MKNLVIKVKTTTSKGHALAMKHELTARGKDVDRITVKRGLFGNKYKVYYRDSAVHEKIGHGLKEGSKKAGKGLGHHLKRALHRE